MRCGYVLAVPVVILAGLVFWLNEPLPPNTANPIKYKIFAAFSKATDSTAVLLSWWTGEDYRLIYSRIIRMIASSVPLQDPDMQVSEEVFEGVTVYVFKPTKSGKNRPGLLYYHGGGFLTNHPLAYESLILKFVKALDIVVVAVDYRLTPTVKAPVPHEDCFKASQHFFANAGKYGVDPKKIGAGGDSAGGNLATSLSLMFRDKGKEQFYYQLLIYPWVQGLDLQTPSYQRNCPSAVSIMNYDAMASYFVSLLGLPLERKADLLANRHVKPETWDRYKKYFNIDEIPRVSIPDYYKPVRPTDIDEKLADAVIDDLTNPIVFPLLADDLSNLPPAYVLTVENDPIRDEGIWLANRLRRAGNKVFHDHNLDGFHVMIFLQNEPLVFDSAVRATNNMISFVKDIMKSGEQERKV